MVKINISDWKLLLLSCNPDIKKKKKSVKPSLLTYFKSYRVYFHENRVLQVLGKQYCSCSSSLMCANKLHKTHSCRATTFIVVQQKQCASYLKWSQVQLKYFCYFAWYSLSRRKCLGALMHTPAKLLLSYAKLDLNASKMASLVLSLLTNKRGKLENLLLCPLTYLSEISIWYEYLTLV